MPIFNRPGNGAGGDPTPPPNDTQIYFEYIYRATPYVEGVTVVDVGDVFTNNANSALATQLAIANQTENEQGIGTYMSTRAAGVYIHVQGVSAQKFGIYKASAAPSTEDGHRLFTVTAVNGLTLTDGDRIRILFDSDANVKLNPVTGNLEVDNVPVAPNILTVDTLDEAAALVTVNAANDRKEFAVLDPGGNSTHAILEPIPVNLIVDNTMLGKLRMMHGMSDIAHNKVLARYRASAAACTARATDSSVLAGRTALTMTAHGIETGAALATTTFWFMVIQTAGAGWTEGEIVRILRVLDANTIIVDKLFSTLTAGNPDFCLINEAAPLRINLPKWRASSKLAVLGMFEFPNTAGNKTFAANFCGKLASDGTTDSVVNYWGGGAAVFTTGNRGVTRTVNVINAGHVDAQVANTIASNNTGTDSAVTTGATPVSAIETDHATVNPFFQYTFTLAAAADWIDIKLIRAGMLW